MRLVVQPAGHCFFCGVQPLFANVRIIRPAFEEIPSGVHPQAGEDAVRVRVAGSVKLHPVGTTTPKSMIFSDKAPLLSRGAQP